MKTARTLVLASLLTAAVFGQLLVLGSLPYSTSWLVRAADSDAFAPPTPGFHIGDVAWPVDGYAASSELDELRRSFEAECEMTTSVDAALCISNRMARQCPHGEPVEELVSTSFDPAGNSKRHAAGSPGHCVTRSAILTGELLSVGVPARIVQLAPLDGSGGHNLVEVWDEETRGWVMVDPTYGGIMGTKSGPTSALALSESPDDVRWFAVGVPPDPFKDLAPVRMEGLYRGLFPSSIIYPEPWLYLRAGDKEAPRPFRGVCLQTGPGAFALGTAQRLAWCTIPMTALAAGLFWGLLVFQLLGARACPERRSESVAPEPT